MITMFKKSSHIWSLIAVIVILVIGIISITGAKNTRLTSEELVEKLYLYSQPKTALGSITKPAIIYQDEEGYFHAYSYNGEKRDLGFKITKEGQTLHFNTSKRGYNEAQLYFDKYKDAVYFMDDKLYRYSLNNKQLTVIELERPINGYSLAGVHNSYVVLRSKGGYAASTTFDIFDMNTKKLIKRVNTSQAEYYQLYEFENSGEFYRLHVANKIGMKNLSGVMWNAPGQDLNIYLESFSNINYGIDKKVPKEHMEYVFSWGESKRPPDNPIYTLKDGLAEDLFLRNPKGNNPPGHRYRVRSLYKVKNGQMALEINNKLLLIDLEVRTAKIMSQQDKIVELLNGAIPLAPPIENLFTYYYNFSDELPFTQVPVEVSSDFVSNIE